MVALIWIVIAAVIFIVGFAQADSHLITLLEAGGLVIGVLAFMYGFFK